MTAWFNALPLDLQVFYGIALIATMMLIIQTVLMFIGGAAHDLHIGDVDSGNAGEHHAGLSVLSLRTLVAFGVGFGWGGVAARESGFGILPATLQGLVAGGALMMAMFWLMRSMLRLTGSGNLDYRNAIGQVATVYLPIPAQSTGPGQVEVMIQGRLVVAQALTKAGQVLPSRTKVKVVDLIDRTTLLVEPA